MSITTLLVANRGEIARRVFRTARTMGVRCIAVYVDSDSDAPFVADADEAVRLAGGYLDSSEVIEAALTSGADAIHPGYGFLAENAGFATAVEAAGLIWVGPSPTVIATMGDKLEAKSAAAAAGVPVLPSSDDPSTAEGVGFPLLVKAAAGGGGKGMRTAHSDISLVKGYHTARSESEKAFGNSGVYIEKFIENPRHIEFQILGDAKGNIIHLGERDCSIQRRNQKLIEETPSPLLEKHKKLRTQMGKAAVKIAQQAEYSNAGTVEFIVDDKGNFYFLEVNKRIQVEHPITEEVTGIDLIKQQILVAMGEPLKLSQSDIKINGHAIECRINAEDPWNDFRPSPGKIEMYFAPGGRGVRLDSHAYAGYTIPTHYDSMIAKLITYGTNRRDAMDKMSRALKEYIIKGIKTTIPFERAVLQDPEFCRGVYSTNFVEDLLGGGRRELIQEKA
ncbi:MAG: acetyl-CoA carboxylase biotin carboxylase subunit [Verrucomicrobiota bacterium]|nr:acetyl-CoA carboxylase biotin carboxylase subunit [Verrucomicrobiota bacterium]